ncbi:sugar phosphate nucleotidyltransferase [Aneurinibacillus aneurinilyticus]|uniref:sugar phosphate nucleotidyltransferase n=1 Tax=Aneurinibacillus aneurinilyticus TaxID=1391 RepID=UPI00042102D0|nr:sugar phosphate nucleotidyltransferase [Aneurinibacillus aneurinilyticus]MED0707553.1 sugar phosphate nucleotidyltransferase [Aneurinibacillus aneurinilyticus]MED0723921.1 sugar phosphate nucleotidyltransferase [Aneurinibacillus aneurinilyticus]MED0731745.1 sugar phosphate nucleotidyltransferase [Aneurinibacillus aneurinilyticus]MED0739407.1 sugar phosphate nucleotidyltransferase [Aneurinibacillus aneurinilyticus]
MKITLLSGGSGKRLWPLSNEVRSKIFLKLLRKEDGSRESMIQRVCRQLDSVGLLQSTYIVTHKSQIEIMKNHVGDSIPIISEPYKKGTFTAAALAITYLHSKIHVKADEIVCVIPVDLFVKTDFFEILNKLPDILIQSQADLALLGTTPMYPSNQFGYIVPKMNNRIDYHPIATFVEKPDERKARRLIKNNALWNCGVFAFPIKFMLSHLKSKSFPLLYEDMLNLYEHLPELGFDYEVVEKNRHSIVIPYNGTWKDLGSWDALVDYLGNSVIGLGQISDDSINTHVVNELPYPVNVIDVPNIIVAASLDGILVASKKNSSRIKQIINNVPKRPLYEEKRWGTYSVLDHSKMENKIETLTKKIKLLPGKNISYQLHHKRKEIWVITSGSGEFILEDKLSYVTIGDVLQIPLGAKHGVKAITPLEFIEVQIGTELVEEDITRLAMTWEEAIRYCKNGGNCEQGS